MLAAISFIPIKKGFIIKSKVYRKNRFTPLNFQLDTIIFAFMENTRA